jgi:hypothetical protein
MLSRDRSRSRQPTNPRPSGYGTTTAGSGRANCRPNRVSSMSLTIFGSSEPGLFVIEAV